MGCVTQIGEQGWNVGRMAVLAAGLAGRGVGDDRRPAVRVVDADELQRGRRRDGGSARPRRLRGRRDDVARADGLERRLDLRARHRPPRHRHAGNLGGAARARVEPVARGARRVLARVAPARDRRVGRADGSNGRSSRSSSRGSQATAAASTLPARAAARSRRRRCSPSTRRRAVTRPPRRSPRCGPRSTRKASSRPGNSSQIVDGSAAVLIASERAVEPARAAAARAVRLLRHRRRRPDADAARQSPCDGEGARARGAHARRDGRDRGERGVRVGRPADRAGPRARGAHGRRQSERRRHLARASARCNRRADHRDAR